MSFGGKSAQALVVRVQGGDADDLKGGACPLGEVVLVSDKQARNLGADGASPE